MIVIADISLVFIELGVTVVGLALLARLAERGGFSTIPLYLLAGLAFGNGGILPLRFTEAFIHIGAEIGVLLLLFMLGLEYQREELRSDLRAGLPAGLVDLLLNFPPGLVAGLVLGWGLLPAVLLGGVTWVSSSGVIAKLASELGWDASAEFRIVISVLVLEDIAMAVYLPAVSVALAGETSGGVLAVTLAVALGTAGAILAAAVAWGGRLSRLLGDPSDEVLLFTTLGLLLLVSGLAQQAQVSSAIGAFFVGIAMSGPIATRAHALVGPLRDLFAAIFFLFFGFQIDPATLPPMLLPAAALALATSATKMGSGWWAAARSGLPRPARIRAGILLIPRGEFSMVIAGLATAAQPQLMPVSAAYVLLLAVLGPLAAKVAERLLGAPPEGAARSG